MPSFWRYFCCICDSANDKRTYSARREWTSRRKNSRRTKSGKNTWARRSLLDNEQVELELNEITRGQIPYQMRAIPTPTYDPEDMSEDSFQEKLQEHFAQRKRPTVHGVFDSSLDDSSASKTTFPWMNERFVPNGRNGTRLGVSAVQMDAKRNGLALNNVEQTTHLNSGRPHAFTPNIKSHSFTEGQDAENVKIHSRHVIKPSANLPKTVNNLQNGQVHVSRNNFNTAPKENTDIRRPVRLGVSSKNSEKPMVLKAPTSDVGVRRVSSKQSNIRQDKIPKLEDYTGFSGLVASENKVVAGHTRPSLMDIFPNSAFNDAENEIEADVSYASEIIFRKQPSEYSGSDVSLKRSSGPGMFSANSSKYERLKPERVNSGKSKSENQKYKGKYSNLSSESMYGYVPKIVQNVHASTALEGTKIDDFFMQRMQERQMDNFGSLDNSKLESDEEPIIITTLVESTEDLTSTDKIDNNAQGNETQNIGNAASSSCVSSEKSSNTKESNSKTTDNTKVESSSVSKTLRHDSSNEDKTKHLNANDDNVIMIDFPPNLENNQNIPILNNLKTRSSNESNSEVNNTSKTVQKKLITGEVLY